MTMNVHPEFRIAELGDLEAIAAIYDDIHTQEERGLVSIGWDRRIYPTIETARNAIDRREMYVAVMDGRIAASGRINREQDPAYAFAAWRYEASDDEVMVLHTLTVDPAYGGRGIAKAFVHFYESYALRHACRYLRLDTNERNGRARALYRKLGYDEVSIVPCRFNGIGGVNLVCLEKRL